MKNNALAIILAVFSLSGCGGGGESSLVSATPTDSGITDADTADMDASALIIDDQAASLNASEHTAFANDWRLKKFELARKGMIGSSVEYDEWSSLAQAHVDSYLLSVHKVVADVRAIHKIDPYAIKQKMVIYQGGDDYYYSANCNGITASIGAYCSNSNTATKVSINQKYVNWYRYVLGI